MRPALANSLRRLTLKGIQKAVRVRFPAVRQLQTSELAAWLADPNRPAPLLLDVRRPEEFAISHLPGAVRVDPGSDAAKLISSFEAGREVVVYCAAGYRSSALAARLRQAGFLRVHNLEGSIFQWANENRPLERDGRPATGVHPYSRLSAKLLKAPARGPRRKQNE
jgi:rhodanese-related sulfurtransferase